MKFFKQLGRIAIILSGMFFAANAFADCASSQYACNARCGGNKACVMSCTTAAFSCLQGGRGGDDDPDTDDSSTDDSYTSRSRNRYTPPARPSAQPQSNSYTPPARNTYSAANNNSYDRRPQQTAPAHQTGEAATHCISTVAPHSFRNNCSYSIEVIWCHDSNEGDTCSRGYNNQSTVHAGETYAWAHLTKPGFRSNVRYAACRGSNSIRSTSEMHRNFQVQCTKVD